MASFEEVQKTILVNSIWLLQGEILDKHPELPAVSLDALQAMSIAELTMLKTSIERTVRSLSSGR